MSQIQTAGTVSKSLGISSRLVRELNEKANMHLLLDYLGESSVFAIVDSISFPKNTVQEEKSMDDLNKANETLSKLEDKDVRIVYLPPMTVAAAHFSGKAEYGVGQAKDLKKPGDHVLRRY